MSQIIFNWLFFLLKILQLNVPDGQFFLRLIIFSIHIFELVFDYFEIFA